MLRLKTPEHLRIVQTDGFEASYGGAESNVSVSLATLGNDAAFLTKLPKNPVGDAAFNELRRYGVDTSRILRGGTRLGIYFFEKGSDIRPTSVLYDRAGSALAEAETSEFDSPSAEQAVFDALKYCHTHGITVICDLNYRAKMWSREKAQSVMKELMQYVDLCIANDEDFEATLGIHAFDGDMAHGIDQIETYRQGMQKIQELYPNCKAVASVLRNLKTAEDGEWMGIYLKDGHFYESPIHTVHSLEAVGAGDAFAGALIHSLVHQFSPQKLIDFSITASVMKLMIQHDFNLVSEEEILRIMKTGETNVIR